MGQGQAGLREGPVAGAYVWAHMHTSAPEAWVKGQGLWAMIDVIRKDRPMPASEQCSPTPKLGQ